MPVHIEGNKILIELKMEDPELFYRSLLKGIPTCVQAIAKGGIDDRDRDLPHSIYTLLDLYKELLPTEKQIERMGRRKGKQ